MSRIEIVNSDNTKMLAVGYDRVTSVFADVFDLTENEDDDKFLMFRVNNMGVYLGSDKLSDRETILASRLDSRFEASKNSGNPYPNLAFSDLMEICDAFGFILSIETKTKIHDAID